MLASGRITPRLNPPTTVAVWLLECGIAFVLSAYVTYQCYQPLMRALNRGAETFLRSSVAILVLLAILLLLWLLLTIVIVLLAGIAPPLARPILDMLALAILIATLSFPMLQNIRATSRSQQLPGKSVQAEHPIQVGRLDSAPAPLKLRRIPLGVEVENAGSHPVHIAVLFVRLNDRGRSYCAGKAIASNSGERSELAAGDRMIFMAGNCQDGRVALTVWDPTGKRIYQTSAILPSEHP